MAKKTLALCIPAFKAGPHLPRLMASARLQDPPFDEIIVCVDACPDDTADVARSFGVTVLVNDTNMGCSASKNRALAAATADWVHFHDADDELLPSFTKEAGRWMNMVDSPDVVIMGFEFRNYETKNLIGISLVDDRELSRDPVRFSIEHKLPNFGIYQRASLLSVGAFDCNPRVLYNEDVAFHTKLAMAGLVFRASTEVTSINWMHSNSMSQQNEIKCLLAHVQVMNNVACKVGDLYPKEIAARYWAAATILAAHKEWGAADSALIEAKRLSGSPPKQISRIFKVLCSVSGVHLAFRIREYAIRILKPGLRFTGP